MSATALVRLAAVAVTVLAVAAPAGPEAAAVALPAGSAGVTLSMVLEDHVEVVRGWPGRIRDVRVPPFRAQFWRNCLPGQGGVFFLITAPLTLPPVWALRSSYYDPDAAVRALGRAVDSRAATGAAARAGTGASWTADAVAATRAWTAQAAAAEAAAAAALAAEGRRLETAGGEARDVARALLRAATPGSPLREALKAAVPEIRNMTTYQRYGYAVFLVLRWQQVGYLSGCLPGFVAVPEGYAIPFTR